MVSFDIEVVIGNSSLRSAQGTFRTHESPCTLTLGTPKAKRNPAAGWQPLAANDPDGGRGRVDRNRSRWVFCLFALFFLFLNVISLSFSPGFASCCRGIVRQPLANWIGFVSTCLQAGSTTSLCEQRLGTLSCLIYFSNFDHFKGREKKILYLLDHSPNTSIVRTGPS